MLKGHARKACLLLALAMVVSAATGCKKSPAGTSGGKSSGYTSGNSWEADKSPITLSIFFDTSGDMDKVWGKDAVSKQFIADTGVNIQFSFAPDKDHTKLSALIASGSMPDMIYASDDLTQDLAKYNQIYALNELSKKYNTNFMNRIDSKAILNKRMKWDSNNLYMSPVYQISQKDMNKEWNVKNITGIAVIDSVYKAVGSPKLKTTDDLTALLKKVKQQYPDMIPAQANRNSGVDTDGNPRLVSKLLPMADLAGRYYKDSSGNYHKYWENADFLTLLKFCNELYNDGLIDKSEFTQTKAQLNAKEYPGKVFADLSQDANNIDWFNSELHKTKPNENWIMIDTPAIKSDMKYASDSVNGGKPDASGLMVTKSCKHPDRAIRWLDYMYTDKAQISIIFGVEGQGYTLKDGSPVATQNSIDSYNKNIDECKQTYGIDEYYNFRTGDWAPLWNYQTASQQQKDAFKVTASYYTDLSQYTSAADNFPANSDEQKAFANIKEYYSTAIMKVLTTSPGNVTTEYNKMIAQMKTLGLEKLNKYWTDYYKNQAVQEKKYSAGLSLK